jgi:hypothetical protein
MIKYEWLDSDTNRKLETVFGKNINQTIIENFIDIDKEFRDNTLNLKEKLDFGISGLIGLVLGFIFSLALNNSELYGNDIYTKDVLKFTAPHNIEKIENVIDCDNKTSEEPEEVC